jgi:UDP-glucose 4-epimerase
MSQRVLLTGSTGFIGSHLVPFLAQNGFDVHCIVRRPNPLSGAAEHICDLTDAGSLETLFGRLKFEFFVHLASRAFPSRDLSDLEAQISNTVLPSIVLARTLPTSLKLAVFFGSCEEYGKGLVPFREDHALHNISPYGWAKISAFHAVQMIALQRNLPVCWARPFLTFGSGQRTNQLVPSLIRGCKLDCDIPLSPGEQTRDFIFVNDLCYMVLNLLKKPTLAGGQVLNLCSGTPRTVRYMAELIQRLCGTGSLRFGALTYRENEAMSFYGCPEKYSSLFGKPNLTPLEEALQQTINEDQI